MFLMIFYARRAAPHQPIHQPVNPGSSKTEAQEAPRRPPGGSKEAPRRLPGGSQAPRKQEFKTDPFQSQKN